MICNLHHLDIQREKNQRSKPFVKAFYDKSHCNSTVNTEKIKNWFQT